MFERFVWYDAPWLRGWKGWSIWVSQWGYSITYTSKKGYVCSTISAAWCVEGFEAQIEVLQYLTEDFVKRRDKPGEGAPIPPHAEYADLLELYPTFAAWMTDGSFEDGSPRPGGWYCVSCRAGVWIATLKDQGEGLQITVTAPSYTLLMSLVESALVDPKAPWRADAGHSNGKPKGKK